VSAANGVKGETLSPREEKHDPESHTLGTEVVVVVVVHSRGKGDIRSGEQLHAAS